MLQQPESKKLCPRKVAGMVSILLGAVGIYVPWVDSSAATTLVVCGAGLLGLTTVDAVRKPSA